jgi:L-lactate dehydrogenase
VDGTDDLDACAGSDVVILAAGTKQKPGQTRLDLAAANVAVCREVVPVHATGSPDALFVVVTNPSMWSPGRPSIPVVFHRGA